MKDFTVSVSKVTYESLMREACESTFIGNSKVSLNTIYKSEHSPSRTQLFWICLKNIPLFVSTHLLRHHVGAVPFQLTCREDRPGGNIGFPEKADSIVNQLEILRHDVAVGCNKNDAFDIIDHALDKLEWMKDNADRQTPVNLSILVNAQSLIDMAKLRLCCKSHPETRTVFNAIKEQIWLIDRDLANMMVRKCVYRNGLCGEPSCCGFNHTTTFKEELTNYISHYSDKQKGTNL